MKEIEEIERERENQRLFLIFESDSSLFSLKRI